MNIQTHLMNGIRMAEVTNDGILVSNPDDGLDILVNLYYQDFDRIILHEKNITPEFFDLKTGIAGEILQKFSNFRVRLAIVGDFSAYTAKSKSLRDFIHECNQGNQVRFVSSADEAIRIWTDPSSV